jgi:glycosyltransferase involved in cell wall biosynthesis
LLRPHPHFLNHASTIADNQRERALAATADQFVSPSRALIQKISKVWDLDPKEIWHIPNPYSGSSQLLEIPLYTKTRVVTFIGRMEINKGVIDLARAIPLILHRYPDTRFRFVGDNFYSPLRGIDMQQYLTYFILNSCRHAVQFEGRVPVDRIPEILASTDICVFPSLWDNFPYVCLEAMAAGRGIVATKSGGMAEMLDGGGVGRLVASQMPSEIAQAVCELLQYPYLRMQLGEAARNRVMTEYTEARICPLFEELYASAIRRR